MQKRNVLETMSAFTISEISFCYFIDVPNCFEHPMRQQSKSLYSHECECMCVAGVFFFRYIVITNRITKHYSVYGISLVCLFMSILFTVYCCVFLYLCEDFNSIHFHFILSLHLIFFLASFLYCISAGSL